MALTSIGNMELFRMRYTEVSRILDHIPCFTSILIQIPDGMFMQRLPIVTTDPNKLEAHAKSILKPTAFNYVAGGAGERATMDANRLAFRQWKLVPRMLRPTTHRDLKVTLFGETYGLDHLFPSIT